MKELLAVSVIDGFVQVKLKFPVELVTVGLICPSSGKADKKASGKNIFKKLISVSIYRAWFFESIRFGRDKSLSASWKDQTRSFFDQAYRPRVHRLTNLLAA